MPTIIPAEVGSLDRTEDVVVADVVVVGAGPSGTAAAITLARAGRDVVLLDKARFPREKCCGDGLTAGALRRLEELGLDPARVPSWQPVEDVVLRSPGGRETTFPLPRGDGLFAAVAKRAELDAELVELARAAGVTIIEGHAMVGARIEDDRVAIEAHELGWIVGRYVIGADGMWSPLRKALGAAVPDYRGDWHAFRQYFGHVSERAATELWVSFEADLVPGYLWSFPVDGGQANVGFAIRRDGNLRVGAMAALWPELLARPSLRAFLGADATPEGTPRAWPIPSRVGSMPHGIARALFVGDAAAASDPMTGEGIGQALATGTWAAEAIIAAGPYDAAAAGARYEAQLRRELVADHRLADALSAVLSHRAAAEQVMRLAASTAWTRRNFARWLFEDYPRALLGTPGRWRPGALRGRGAYRT